MTGAELHEILEAASRHVSAWPEWMQQPEYRRRQPVGNSIAQPKSASASSRPKPRRTRVRGATVSSNA